jgi:hypothetical protein
VVSFKRRPLYPQEESLYNHRIGSVFFLKIGLRQAHMTKRERGDKRSDPRTEMPKTRTGKMALEGDQNASEDR